MGIRNFSQYLFPAIHYYLLLVPHKRISVSIRATMSRETFFNFYYGETWGEGFMTTGNEAKDNCANFFV